jgi:hypothetical protein
MPGKSMKLPSITKIVTLRGKAIQFRRALAIIRKRIRTYGRERRGSEFICMKISNYLKGDLQDVYG